MDIKTTLHFAQNLAREAGEIITSKSGDFEIMDYKDRQDIVTSVDLAAEKHIISAINKKFPDHAIYSEEAGEDNKESEYKWIIDPLDGTKEFSREIPMYNTCFALEKNGEAILSIVYRPSNGAMYSAAAGVGAFKDGKKVSVSDQKRLDSSFVFSYLPTYKVDSKEAEDKYKILFNISRKAYRLRGIAEESASLCWVGSGMVEASINLGPQPKWHDIVPGLFFAKEAGATVTDTLGKEIITNNLSSGFVVTNGHIHEELLEVIQG